jgi:hypothetical protein
MIGYTLKTVLELVPEALDFVKKASLEQDYPTNSKDSCLASALVAKYQTEVSGQKVDYDVLEKVASGVTAYNLSETYKELSSKLLDRSKAQFVKQASAETEETFMTKQAHWEGELSGFKDIENLVKQAEELKVISDRLGAKLSPRVQTYLCDGYLSKQAALGALAARFQLTKNDVLLKIAAALSKESEFIPGGALVKNLCNTVTQLDKKAGISAKGFDFYREAMITKSAAMSSCNVNVAGTSYPLQRVMSMPSSYIDSYLGKGFSDELSSDPMSAKAMVESLPMDTQNVLKTILNS